MAVKNYKPTSAGRRSMSVSNFSELSRKGPERSLVEGRVRNLTNFGAFVELEEGVDGLVHISDMSWTKRIEHPNEVVKIRPWPVEAS